MNLQCGTRLDPRSAGAATGYAGVTSPRVSRNAATSPSVWLADRPFSRENREKRTFTQAPTAQPEIQLTGLPYEHSFRRASPIARPLRWNRTQQGQCWRGRLVTARSGERRITTGGHRFVGWRPASAKAPNERHSSASTSGPFRSAATHIARPSRAYPADRHYEHP